MAVNLFKAPSAPFTARLDGRFASADSTMVLTNVEGLQAPGVVVVERLDTSGIASTKKEYCSYTGVSGTSLTGVGRGLAGSTAVDHGSGALIECYFSISHWTDLQNNLLVEHASATGIEPITTHVRTIQFTGISGLSGLKGDVVLSAIGSFTLGNISNVSGYPNIWIDIGSYQGGIPPFFVEGGLISGTTGVTPLNIIEHNYSLRYVSALLKYPASGASLVLDINKNGTSIFDAVNRLCIPGGGTFASTASIATKSLSPGNLVTLDIDICGQAGDLTVVLGV